MAGPSVRGDGRSRAPSWPPASGPRSSWPRPPSTCICGHRAGTPCCYPSVSYPTYAMGALLGGCRAVAVPELPGRWSRPVLDRRRRHRPGPGAVDQLAVQPDRPAQRPGRGGPSGGRDHGVPVFSDECYAEFTWDGPPRTVLATGRGRGGRRALPVEALQPGRGAGGLLRRRPRTGRVPHRRATPRRTHGPRPGAGRRRGGLRGRRPRRRQRRRYAERLEFLRRELARAGLPTAMPAGGFYLWVPVPGTVPGAGWGLAEALALEGGLLVSPGELYGPDGAGLRPGRRRPAHGATGAGGRAAVPPPGDGRAPDRGRPRSGRRAAGPRANVCPHG